MQSKLVFSRIDEVHDDELLICGHHLQQFAGKPTINGFQVAFYFIEFSPSKVFTGELNFLHWVWVLYIIYGMLSFIYNL